MLPDALASILVVALMLAAAAAVGRAIWRRLDVEMDELSAGLWSVALGLALLGALSPAVAACGGLQFAPVATVTVVLAVFGVADWLSNWIDGRVAPEVRSACPPAHFPRFTLECFAAPAKGEVASPPAALPPSIMSVLWITLSLVVPATCLIALAPPVGQSLDALSDLQRALTDGRHVCWPAAGGATATQALPWLVEGWCLWAMTLGGPHAVGLFFWSITALAALATYPLVQRIFGPPIAGAAAMLAFIALAATVDFTCAGPALPTALFLLLAADGLLRGQKENRPTQPLELTGLAAGVVLTLQSVVAVLVLAALAAVSLLPTESASADTARSARRPTRDLGRGLVRLAAVAGLFAAAVSLAGVVIEARSPSTILPLVKSDPQVAARVAIPQAMMQGRWLLALLALGAAPATPIAAWQRRPLLPSSRGGEPRAHCWGEDRMRNAAWDWMFIACVVGGLAAVTFGAGLETLFVLAPFAAMAIVRAWTEIEHWPIGPRRLATTAAWIALAVMLIPPLRQAVHAGPAVLGTAARESYLVAQEPTFPAAEAVNQLVPAGELLLSDEPRTCLFHCRTLGATDPAGRKLIDACLQTPVEAAPILRTAGVHYLLMVNAVTSGAAVEERHGTALANALDRQLAARGSGFLTMLEYAHRSEQGAVRHYRLLQILPGR